MGFNKTLAELRLELAEIQEKIAATNKRLPAHSAKPPIMRELFELEDRYEDLLKQVRQLEKRE